MFPCPAPGREPSGRNRQAKTFSFRVVSPTGPRYPSRPLSRNETPVLPPSMATMKVRSFLLLVCMLVVPALALFSHLTPPSARSMLRRTVSQPLCQLFNSIQASLPFMASGTPREARAVKSPAPRPAPVPSESAATARRPAAEPAEPIPMLPLVTVPATPVSDPTVARDLPRSPSDWAALATLRSQLSALGATAIDCRPQAGDSMGFASSCRIGIDRDGQLHRMFHARGADEAAALQSLIDQVEGWRTQQAGGLRQRY